jgi:WD40 repeat protein/serine/threonine protein kinase
MSVSQATAICPKCKRALPPDAPRGLCAKCLFSVMLAGPLDASPSSTARKATLPREFGSYELLAEVARGGMGIVYKARQTQINRVVALKVMAAGQFAAPDFVKRFRTEAEAVAQLDHPNIVPIYEVGENEGQPFFSMKFVEGGSLASRVANSNAPIANERAAEILVALARAVHYAHQRGILHRDIKPANVLLDAEDKPLLTDFGLAKLVEKDSTLTHTMAILGTPSYMSPEQARGEAKQLTIAVDVYGLGAILYELLTGQPPFGAGTTMETVRQVLDKEPRRPSLLKPGLDRDLETICLKCLEKNPTQRYGSAETLADDLERWLHHEPILARPATTIERASKLVRRHPVGAAFSAAICIIIVASVVMLARANLRIRTAQRHEATLRHEAERKTEEGRQRLVRLNVSSGNRLVEEGDYFKALLSFTEALRLENNDAAREEVHRRRYGAVLRQSPQLAQIWFHDALVLTAEFSPRGDRVVSTGVSRDARIWDVTTGDAATPPLHHLADVTEAKFTPDGKRVATLDASGRFQLWDAAMGELLGPPGETNARVELGTIEFSADGKWMAVPTARGVQLFDAAGETRGPLLASPKGADFARFSPSGDQLAAMQGREVTLWTLTAGNWESKIFKHPSNPRQLSFSRDGAILATTTLRQVFTWDVASGKLSQPAMESSGDLFDCRFSADGRWMVTASWDGAIRLFDAHSLRPVRDSMRHRAGVARAVFSPDSRFLATASWDHTARVWDPLRGEAATPSLPHGGYVLAVNFSSDGKQLVTGSQDQTVRLWNLRTNSGARLTLRHERTVSFVQYSRDGQRLLTCSHDGRANVSDARTGRLLLALPRQSQGIIHGSFSPDGKLIATACTDGGARVHNATTGEPVGSTMQHSNPLTFLSFSPDGQRIVVASKDGTACVWNVANGKAITPMLRHTGDVVQATFSPDGRHVLTASKDQTARIWDAETGAPVVTIQHVGEVQQAEFSPDGKRIVTACTDRTQLARAAQMWDAATGKAIGAEMPHLDGVMCAQFSPNGRFIATGGEDRVAVVWDGASGKRLTSPMHQASYITRCEFSPDSRLLLTLSGMGSDSFEARVWESETGEAVTPLLKHSAGPSSCAWSPDGREIAIGTSDGTVSLWDVSPVQGAVETLQRHAETLAAHRMDPSHSLVPLNAKEMRERWEAMKAAPSR